MRLAQLPREYYIPTNSIEISEPSGLAVAYAYTAGNGRPAAVAFIGKACKPAWNESFSTPEKREIKVGKQFDSLRRREASKTERRRERNAGHSFAANDIAVNSWGYDQTNVDWYQVTRVTKNYVWIKRIGSAETDDAKGFMCDHVIPRIDPDSDKPEEKHKAEGTKISMELGPASKWDGKPRYRSWYA